MPISSEITLPPRLKGAFSMMGALHDSDAEVRTMMMAEAILYDDGLLYSDEDYLQFVGGNLIESQVRVSKSLRLKTSNISNGTDLFDLEPDDKFDWAIFCNWRVTGDAPKDCNSDATYESPRTFEKNRWTKTFSDAGLRGFTVVNFTDAPNSFERLKELALQNNSGIELKGNEYRFESCNKPFRAQNYSFDHR